MKNRDTRADEVGGDPWSRAASMNDLLALTRAFLAGSLETFPGWGGSDLDEESDALGATLIAANDLGLLSVASQPGCPFSPGHDGRSWARRAFLGGFVRPESVPELRARAAANGLWCLEEPAQQSADEFGETGAVPVGLRDGVPYLVLGHGARSEELDIFRGALGDAAYAELEGCSLLWLVDPVWGRRARLPRIARPLSPV